VILQQSASGTIQVKVQPRGGFSGSVSLEATGLPNGVTATFQPASTSSQSTMTLTVSSATATGSASITVTGTSGSLAPTTTINLTVLIAPPAGSVPQSFFALNNVDPTDDPTADGMFYGGVGHPIRLAWPYIETSKGVFDFSFYDEYAAIAPKDPTGTIAMMDLALGMTPSWAVANQSTCRQLNGGATACQAPPDDIQDWKDFITALINHYNGTTAPHIQYYEIWNEWNVNDQNNGFWSGSDAQLAAMQQAACTIIHGGSGDPFSKVVTPSTVGSARFATDQAPAQLTAYFNAGGKSCPGAPNNVIDAVSFHGNVGIMSITPYPLPGEGCSQSGCNGTIIQIANSYRQVMNLNGLQSIPLLDTEGGFEAANITDANERAAWLAQFYALQAGLFNSDQLIWNSWFTWGAPGVAGNIENSNQSPNAGGVAYNQVFNWLFGRFPAPCAQAGTVWTCPLTGSSGYTAEIVWDDSQTCSSNSCTSKQQPTPTGAVRFRDLAGNVTQISGSTIPVSLRPILIENQ